MVGGAISARLYCSSKALWKLAWFFRDFRYDQELLERDEIDVRALVGLQGIIQIAHEGCRREKFLCFCVEITIRKILGSVPISTLG